MTDRAFLSVFTPSRSRPEDLEAIHVQRETLLGDAVERARESATSGNKHHLLFVGPRGTGKTHLVTLLVHRLDQDRELTKHLRIAWLNEDETSTTLLELLHRIYLALNKRHPDEYPKNSIEPMFNLGQQDAARWLARLILEKLKNRTLLVVIENLDALFEGLGKTGQQKLRALIQEHPVVSLVATAQRLVDDLSKRDNAFFGFFQTEQLKALSVEHAAELLGKVATLNGKLDVAEFLRGAAGHSRVRALHHLAGGNHRIYLVLSQFITRDSIDALVGPFCKMIDEMTPYYQERIHWLPTQQRKIVEYLCSCQRPIPVKQMARRLFASQQTISSQLRDLRNKGYVQATQRGRQSLYEIAEPLMRICVEVKANQTHAPLRVLVDFLRAWYDVGELFDRLGSYRAGSVACDYLQSALERTVSHGDLRRQLLVEDYRTQLCDEQWSRSGNFIESLARISEELAMAYGEWARGNDAGALAVIKEVTDEAFAHPGSIRASAWLLAAEIHYERDRLAPAIKSLDSILALTDAPIDLTARAFCNRGVMHLKRGEAEQAIADYSAVIELQNVRVEQVTTALCNRAAAYARLGDTQQAIADYSAVINLVGAPIEQVTRALIHRGVAYQQLGETQQAIADYSTVIDFVGAPVEQVTRALINRGAVHQQLGDTGKKIADFSAIINLENAPVEQVAAALNIRSLTYGQIGKTEQAITDCNSVLDLKHAPVEQVAIALNNRGVTYGQLGKTEKEIADFNAVVGTENTPARQVAITLCNRGDTYRQLGDTKRALADYRSVIDLENAPVEQVAIALNNRSAIYGQLGKREQAIADYSAVICLENAPAKEITIAHLNRGVMYGLIPDTEKEIADYSTVINLTDPPVELLAFALNNRSIANERLGNIAQTIADCSAVIDLKNAPTEQVSIALNNRGVVYGQLGDTEKELADYSAAINLDNAPVEQVARALYRRGVRYGRLGDADKEIADYSAIIELRKVPLEQTASALNNRGVAYGQLASTEQAIVNFSAVIDLENAPRKQVAIALHNRGAAYYRQRDFERSERDFEAVLRLTGASIPLRTDSRLALAVIRIGDGRWNSAISELTAGLLDGTHQHQAYFGDLKGVISVFFSITISSGIRRKRCRELALVYRNSNAISQLGQALVRHLGSLFSLPEDFPAVDSLEQWASAWEDAGNDIDEFHPALRIFRTGIDFLKSGDKDRGILLNLNQEDRKILEQALGLDTR